MATRDDPTDELTVHWDPSVCIHSGVCARTLPAVFRPRRRPWVTPQGATPVEIAATIDTCPSGALAYTWAGASNQDTAGVGPAAPR